jgi:hypothetical protein
VANDRRTKRISYNFIVIVLLIFLATLALSPGRLVTLISEYVPLIYDGVACANLRRGENRAFHQSLLGRGDPSPIGLDVRTSAVPTTADGQLIIYITVINESVGTVPIVYDPNQVIIGDNGTSGLGIIFTPQTQLFTAGRTEVQPTDSQILLLTPRQRCVHEVRIPGASVIVDPTLVNGGSQVRAYYRNNSVGFTAPPPGTLATPIFFDQGLWTGYVESSNVFLPPAGVQPVS